MRGRFVVSLVLTHRCNLACSYCYMGEHHATAMPRRVAELALDAAFAESPSVHLGFFGGEPLLEWDLMIAIAASARRRAAACMGSVSFQVTTNGTLIDERRAATLVALGIDVAVSLDGSARVHDRARANASGGPSFRRVLAGIEALRAAGAKPDLVAVVTPANVRDLCDSVRTLDALGPAGIVLSPDWGAAWTDADLAAWKRQLAELCAMWAERFERGDPLPLRLFEGKLAAAARGARVAECSVGRWNVAVAPSGHLYPCDRLVGDDRARRWMVGHIDQGLAARERLARGHHDPSCAPCAERFRCGGSCACANIAEAGAPDRPGGVQCWYEQTVAELADEVGWRLLARGHAGFARAAYGRASSGAVPRRVAAHRRLPVLR